MGDQGAGLRAACAEAYRSGEAILRLLDRPLDDAGLDEAERLLEQRTAAIEGMAGLRGGPGAEEALQALVRQQQELDMRCRALLDQTRGAAAAFGASSHDLQAFRRLMKPGNSARMLDERS